MSISVLESQETQRLSDVLDVIGRQIESLRRRRKKGAEELVNYRKYMWEDAALFDRAERVQSENVALTQEQAVMDVGLRLKRLDLLSRTPYFGRIDFREAGNPDALPVYIGIHGLFGDSHESLIYDWRAPVSGVFYDHEIGPAEYAAPEGVISGELTLKRQYKIENGQLIYVLDSSLTISDDILREALARNTSEKMRHIVNSIQKEQNAIIRSEGRRILVVQGPAGSGKTSVAMHRAAYLLYRHQGHISANNLLIFSPNEVFADYISNVLPELGEENIREATFDDYARSNLGKKVFFETKSAQMEFILSGSRDHAHALRTASIAMKSSQTFLEVIRNYARRLRRSNIRFGDIKLNEVVVLRGEIVERLYNEYCAEWPLMQAIERLKDRVLAKSTYSSELAERRILREVDKMVIDRDPVRLYKKLFSNPALIEQLAEDMPLPDTLRPICKMTQKSLQGGKKLLYEDVAPILLLKKLLDGSPGYGNVRHVIIDEAQDYTPIHFEIIQSLFGDSSITILGDLSQRINAYSGLDGYDALGTVFGQQAREVVRLTKSYRSSWEISEFARGMLPDAESVDNIRRSGRKPRIVQSDSDSILDAISAEIDELKADGMSSIAVICKTAPEAFRAYSKLLHSHDIRLVESESITFHHGMVVLPAYMAKGLEFDAVIIHDASASVYGSESERSLLYTACTRALHSLTLYVGGEPSPLLPIDRRELFEM